MNDSLLSFRRHEEELLRTDITQDDLVLSFNSADVRRSLEAESSLRRSKELPAMLSASNRIPEVHQESAEDQYPGNFDQNGILAPTKAPNLDFENHASSFSLTDQHNKVVMFVDGITEGESGDGEGRQAPSLQELFNSRMQKFIEVSKSRQEQQKINQGSSLTPKQVCFLHQWS